MCSQRSHLLRPLGSQERTVISSSTSKAFASMPCLRLSRTSSKWGRSNGACRLCEITHILSRRRPQEVHSNDRQDNLELDLERTPCPKHPTPAEAQFPGSVPFAKLARSARRVSSSNLLSKYRACAFVRLQSFDVTMQTFVQKSLFSSLTWLLMRSETLSPSPT